MNADTSPAVVARDLSIRYPSRYPEDRPLPVNGVTFVIPHGEILAVVGETGSGKSTLAATVAGHADTGEIGGPIIHGGSLRVLDYDVRHITERKRDKLTLRTGYLPQDAGSSLAARLTVGENVAEPIFSRDRRFDQVEAGQAVATLIDAVRLPLSVMNRFPHELSRGQRQRVAIARALILEPVLLVADDPTSGIDLTVRSAILDIIKDLQKDRAFSALVVTTDLQEVRRVTDQVMIMHRGVVVGHGQVDAVLADPRHHYVAGLARSLATIGTEPTSAAR